MYLRIFSPFLLIIFCCPFCLSQNNDVYQWNWKKDGITLLSSGAAWGGSQYLKSRADKTTEADILKLNASDVWAFDRGATDNFSQSSVDWSNYLLFSSITLPFTFYLGKKGRNEGIAILGMTIEAFFISDGLTNILKATTKRFRPSNYNDEISLEDKLTRGSRYSFVSGHASNTAMSTFFFAKVFSDLHSESSWKPVVWSVAAAVPALTGYLRYKAGRHFPTDLIVGYGIGALVGYFVPHFHKISNKSMAFQLIPLQNGIAFAFQKRL